ncbi:MAG: PLD nuclease N-terminal domain-containing protein [Prosthecobacter sp.]
MRDTILRFFLIQPLNSHPMVLWGLAAVWLVLIFNCVHSLRQQAMSLPARWAWLLVIILVPIAGMAAYLVYCLTKADYSFMKFLLGPPKRSNPLHDPRLRLPNVRH